MSRKDEKIKEKEGKRKIEEEEESSLIKQSARSHQQLAQQGPPPNRNRLARTARTPAGYDRREKERGKGTNEGPRHRKRGENTAGRH